MKIVKITSIILCFCIVTIQAQKKENECLQNIEKALILLKEKEGVNKSIKTLRSCVKKGNPEAQLLLGKIFLTQQKESRQKKGFKLIKNLAKKGNSEAMVLLGDLFKKGIATDINISKAKKWYKKAHKLKNSKGTYALGYMHYKGLGNTPQNYEKAVDLFKQSTYPMATHWLAMAYYFGNGVDQNKDKAIELLKINKGIDEKVIIHCMEVHKNKDFKISELQNKLITDENNVYQYNNSKKLIGKWEGSLLQMDWSQTKLIQEIPVTLNFKKDLENSFKYTFKINDYKNKGSVTQYGNELLFEDFELPINRTFFSNQLEKTINYQIINANSNFKKIDNQEYFIISIESYAGELAESGPKFFMILTKKQQFTENGNEISEEIVDNLQKAENSFIKLYPNPFESELYISYTLEEKGYTQIDATNILTGKKRIIEQGKNQAEGKYIYFLDGNNLKKGIYAISVYVNGSKKTETILKK